MKLTFLGTGGAMPIPRPFCDCEICSKARKHGEPYKRNSSSLYIEDISGVIDCPEDIADSLNRRGVMKVDNLFVTHWHPDHTFGLRPILEANYDFISEKADKAINVYMPQKVYEQLNKVYPNFYYFEHIAKMCVVHKLEHNESVEINGHKVTAVGYEGDESSTFAYMVESENKKLVYASCDTIGFNYEIENVDLLINECGILSPEVDSEIKFENLMKTIASKSIRRTLLTHIEEVEVRRFGLEHYNQLKSDYKDIDFDYAYDGMEVEL